MEQFEGENEALHQERPQPPLFCPRCGSLDTKFRYFNNNNYAQPRHYCKTCNRMWTVGGNLRPIPFGGRSKNKTTKNSSSTCGNLYQPPQRQRLSMEQLQISQHLTPRATMVPQNYDATMIHQPITNMPDPIPQLSSSNLNDEISDFETIQSLLKPEMMNQPIYVGSEFDLSYLQDVQDMPSQQALPQHFMEPLDTYQINNQVNNVGPYHLPNYNMVQPSSPMNYMPSDSIDNFSLWNNFSGGSSDTETSTIFMDTNQWPSFPSYGPP